MSPPLNPAELYDIKKALKYYQYDVEEEDLKANDFKWLLQFVGALLKYVEYQKGIIFEQADGLRELGVSMDTLKKEVGAFMRKRKASGEIEGGEGRSKRVKSGFDNDGGSQKRSRSEDSKDEGGRSKRMRRSESKNDAGRPKRSHGEETEDEGGKSKRRRRA
ncbi:hypothetical protein K469DRAFT_698453 [Zopfia rhizophila CBS 207.26]|uniref:Uncharacterized protein n=1 Tax=Zopfia rhizophila CBS 207.26 TaxID=1314779 RepID=A0A6A6DBU9_9PEZI|nr:hypothetical protein K469DRAFT_698453 [Zopfia rhizophila CBS 207.26]